jgi:uncharacterized glyoxalase superfamily protein PhnB
VQHAHPPRSRLRCQAQLASTLAAGRAVRSSAAPEPGTAGIRFTIGVQVDSAGEIDRLTEQMRAAGARVTREPINAEFFTGRSACLCDPEGNYFEIAWADMPNNPVVIALRRAVGA